MNVKRQDPHRRSPLLQAEGKSTRGSEQLRALDLLRMAAWFGLVTGLVEGLVIVVQKTLLHQFPHDGFNRPLPFDVVWMAPLADLFLFSSLGLVLSIAVCTWTGLLSPRRSLFVFCLLSVLGMGGLLPGVHRYAWLLLAAGLANVVSGVVANHFEGFQRLRRRTLVGLLLLVAGLAAGLCGWEAFSEHRRLDKCPSSTTGVPNVLLIVLDTVRAESLSLYGYERPTAPNLERIAKTGVSFERAISPSSWTLPAHASMFTGRWPHEMSADWGIPLDGAHPTLAEIASERGYRTAGFVANRYFCGREYGLNRGFVHYDDRDLSLGQILLSCHLGRLIAKREFAQAIGGEFLGQRNAATLNGAFLNWLSRDPQRPFCVFMNYIDAHEPYLPSKDFYARFGFVKPNSLWIRGWHEKGYPPEKIQAFKDAYDSCVAGLDDQIGRLLGELDNEGYLENTLVIITSDHGEQFGEHRLMGHGNSAYLPLIRVPLVISFPGRIPPGVVVHDAVSLRDLPATVIDLLGIKDEVTFPGASLRPHWSDGQDLATKAASYAASELNANPAARGFPNWIPSSKGPARSLVLGNHHYIRNGDGTEELYDITDDPGETRNRAADEECRPALARVRAALRTILGDEHSLEHPLLREETQAAERK